MSTRRHFMQQCALMGAFFASSPWWSRYGLAEAGMLNRSIPASGERLPVIGLGTSRTFDIDLASAELQPLREVMAAFIAGGGKLIDTAPSYRRSEAVSGALVAGAKARESVFLATKVSSTGREAGLRQIEASFKALQTDRIDLIQVHNLQDTQTQLATLRELKAQGRIRYIGVTHYLESAHDDLLTVLKREPVDFVQFNYSVGARGAEKALLPYCRDHGIATLINRTYQAGELFDRVKGKPVPEWASAELDATSWAQLMLKFVVADPAVTVVIPATSKPRYMLDNLAAGHGRLPDAGQRQRIVEAFA